MADSVVLQGEVLADGSLKIPDRVPLRPGRLEVTIKPVEQNARWPGVLELLPWMRARQQSRGHAPRSAEEVDRYVRDMRDEWEERQARIEAIQEEGALQALPKPTPARGL